MLKFAPVLMVGMLVFVALGGSNAFSQTANTNSAAQIEILSRITFYSPKYVPFRPAGRFVTQKPPRFETQFDGIAYIRGYRVAATLHYGSNETPVLRAWLPTDTKQKENEIFEFPPDTPVPNRITVKISFDDLPGYAYQETWEVVSSGSTTTKLNSLERRRITPKVPEMPITPPVIVKALEEENQKLRDQNKDLSTKNADMALEIKKLQDAVESATAVVADAPIAHGYSLYSLLGIAVLCFVAGLIAGVFLFSFTYPTDAKKENNTTE